MIGTGIFLKPAEMAREAGSTAVVFAAWIVGGVLSMFGALSFAELGAEIPEAGGEYAYLRRGFGPVLGISIRLDAFNRRPSVIHRIDCGRLNAIRRFFVSLLSQRQFIRSTYNCLFSRAIIPSLRLRGHNRLPFSRSS